MDVDREEKQGAMRVSKMKKSNITICKIKEMELREINIDDPNEVHFRFIYSRERIRTIESIDIVNNEKIQTAFNNKENEFKMRNIPYRPILAYHGTDACT